MLTLATGPISEFAGSQHGGSRFRVELNLLDTGDAIDSDLMDGFGHAGKELVAIMQLEKCLDLSTEQRTAVREIMKSARTVSTGN